MIPRLPISLFVFLMPFLCSAYEWTGTVSAGARYNSNVEYLYLIDRIQYTEEHKTKNIPKIDSFFATLDGSIGLFFGDDYRAGLQYSLITESGLDQPELSRFNQYLSGSYSKVFRARLFLDTSLTLHHVAERWPVPRSLFGDIFGWATLLYDHNDYVASFGTFRAGYYRNLDPFTDKRLEYFNGPAAGIEGGWYVYPSGGESYIKTTVSLDLYWLRDEEYDYYENISGDVLGVSNRYLRFAPAFEAAYIAQSFTLSLLLRYTYQYWLTIDTFMLKDWEKRRLEHTFFAEAAFEYRFTEEWNITLSGSVMNKLSNIGEDKDDYTDYSLFQGTVGVKAGYTF